MNSNANLMPTIAVTGAGGLVGSYLVQYLHAKGYPVIAVVRTPGKPKHLVDWLGGAGSEGAKVTLKLADVNDLAQMSAALDGADLVVHAAGEVNPYGTRNRIFHTNVQGTQTVLESSRKAQLKQFIHISSLSVITGQGDQFDVDETAPLRFCGENYADSKASAEQMLRDKMSEAGTTPITILRPGFIYGPYEKTWMPRLIESIRTGKAALIDGGTKETNVINVENLCRAIELAFLNEKAYGETFNLTDGQKVTKKMLFDAIADCMNMKRVTKVIPSAIAKPFCECVSLIAPLLPVEMQQKLARYSRAGFRLAGVNQGFSVKKAETRLGYTNRVPFAKGMPEVLKLFSSVQDGVSAAGNGARGATVNESGKSTAGRPG